MTPGYWSDLAHWFATVILVVLVFGLHPAIGLAQLPLRISAYFPNRTSNGQPPTAEARNIDVAGDAIVSGCFEANLNAQPIPF